MLERIITDQDKQLAELRAERTRLHESIESCARQYEERAAECAKFRAALERIESCADDSFVMRDIAREALRHGS